MCGIELRCMWLYWMMIFNTCVDAITWMAIYECCGIIECFSFKSNMWIAMYDAHVYMVNQVMLL